MQRNIQFIPIILALALFSVSYAQIGEVAGALVLNVSLGGSNSTTLTILNSGAQPIPFNVTLPTLSTIPNRTTPRVTVRPMEGEIPAHSQLVLNVTAYMPSAKNKPGLSWSGIIQVVQTSNSTQKGVAIIQGGVAKIITINSIAPKSSIYTYLVPAVGLIVIIALALGAYWYTRNRKAKAPRSAAASRTTSSTKRKEARRKRQT